eukprot:1174270-Prymnesium_polylepis.1
MIGWPLLTVCCEPTRVKKLCMDAGVTSSIGRGGGASQASSSLPACAPMAMLWYRVSLALLWVARKVDDSTFSQANFQPDEVSDEPKSQISVAEITSVMVTRPSVQ